MTPSHSWRFFRAGGFDQVRLDRGADLAALDTLDQKLWVALACPTRGLEFDARTLELVDADGDGRIRAPEVIAATKWACACLGDPDRLLKGGDSLPLSALNEATAEGREVLAAARHVLAALGKPGADSVALADVADLRRLFAAMRFNGDGVVAPASAGDPGLAADLELVASLYEGPLDRSGAPGVDAARLDRLEAEGRAWLAWSAGAVLPLGPATDAAASALAAVEGRVDAWFDAARLAAWDPRALAALEAEEASRLASAAKDLALDPGEVSGLPLARVVADGALPLRRGLNPAWASAVDAFARAVVTPLLGEREALSAAEWADLKARLAPYRAWRAGEPATKLAALGTDRVAALLGRVAPLRALVAEDLAVAREAEAIARVEKLLRLVRDLRGLLDNFVSFRDFYGRRKAVFQAGTLYLDQRACDLCVRVSDGAKHASLAGMSRTYLAYCDVVRRGTGETMTIAAAFTDGDSDNLLVGRNGVFYDREGRDWDATITKIVDNPISLRQAFWAPYKKVARLVEEQVAKFAASKEKAVDDAAAAKVSESASGGGKAEAFDVAKFAGIFAAIGLAIGAIGGAIGAMLTAFASLAWWQIPLAIAGIVLLVSGPSVLLAWLKLRQRNLGPLLDANGWAINARAAINLPFGASLTAVAKLPEGASRDLADPFEEKHTGRKVFAVVLLLVAALAATWSAGLLSSWLPFVPPPPHAVDAAPAP
ncbi:MAG: hypothetical protein ACOZNI_25745 [Myxococcota bacterium]